LGSQWWTPRLVWP